jgi:NAD(P)-dependent dehydrogenase (short-subunit alcohol dehydrogenase family)
MRARREVVSAVANRYQSAERSAKGRILDELCATTGWHRKHAVRALRQHETEGSLSDLDWKKRTWDPAKAYAESKLHVVALAIALARRWPHVLSNAVDPGWTRTRIGGPGAPVGLDTGQRTQTWLAVSDDPAARVTGRYWHHLRQEQPPSEASNPEFQDQLIAKLDGLTGVARPEG